MKKCPLCGRIEKNHVHICDNCGVSLDKISVWKTLIKVLLYILAFSICSILFPMVLANLFLTFVSISVNLLPSFIGDLKLNYITFSLIITIIADLLFVGMICAFFALRVKRPSEEVRFRKFPLWTVPVCAVLGYCMNPVITFLTGLIPWPEQFFKYHDTILNSEVMKNLPLTIITISLVTGFTEEFLFRGIVMTRLKRICNSTLTVIISALIFSAIHGDPISFLGIFIIGVLLGVVFLRYDSVIPCMIIHAAFNLFAILGFPSNHPLFVLGFVLTCAAVSLGMGYILLRKPTKVNSFEPYEDSVSENENVTE